jgi:hypothetical protein
MPTVADQAALAAASAARAAELARGAVAEARAAQAAGATQATTAAEATGTAQAAVQAVVARAAEVALAAAEATTAVRAAADATTVAVATARAKKAAQAAARAEAAAEAAARATAAAQAVLAGRAAQVNDPDPRWMRWWPTYRAPDFEKTVGVVLATFTVFTGFTTGKAVEAVANHLAFPPGTSHLTFLPSFSRFFEAVWSTEEFWALIALLSLLLRYLIGSAIHLNDTYVKRVGTPNPAPPVLPPRFQPSRSTFLLFKDLLFIVVFGIVILGIAKTIDPATPQGWVRPPDFDFAGFTFGSEIFLLCGFVWAIVDIPCRLAAGRWAGNDRDREWPGRHAYYLWPALDAAQFLITLWISSWSATTIWQVRWLAVAYVGFLFADIWGYIRGLRTRAPA